MKRIAYLIAILCVSALATALVACGGDDDDSGDSANDGSGDSAAALPENGDDGEDSDGLDLLNDDLEEDLEDLLDDEGNIDIENLPFGRASDEAYAVATDACIQWAVWDVDEGESQLDDILALATDALEMDEDTRDPVLVRLEADLSSLMLALQRGDGSGVIDLASSSVDLDCQAI